VPSTYTPIGNTTTSNNTTTQISFSSISGYTDLLIVQSLPNDPNGTYGGVTLRFNSDTTNSYGSNYFYYYNGITPGRQTSSTSINISGTSSYMGNGNIITSILNYANPNGHKTVLTRANMSENAGGVSRETFISAGTYRKNDEITSVQISTGTGFSIDSTFTLYGIKAA
jgi:hypothetical protein